MYFERASHFAWVDTSFELPHTIVPSYFSIRAVAMELNASTYTKENEEYIFEISISERERNTQATWFFVCVIYKSHISIMYEFVRKLRRMRTVF